MGIRSRFAGPALALIMLGFMLGSIPGAFGADAEPPAELFVVQGVDDDVVILEWDRAAVRAAAERPRQHLTARFRLRADLTVAVELEPFSIVGPTTRFVRGRLGAPDEPIDFDPSSVSLFRGSVVDRPGSRVFLALSELGSTGVIDLGDGRPVYRVASGDRNGEQVSRNRISVFATRPQAELPPDIPSCGNKSSGRDEEMPIANRIAALEPPYPGLKHLQLAIETDHEYFTLFGDTDAAMTYTLELYAQVSDIYIRDVDTRIELSFIRIWDDPDDLFNDVDPSPLGEFRDYWNFNMGTVVRDAAQLISGRRDYPFGGQASFSALCNSSAYSVVGYMQGSFPDPSQPSPYSYDISVTAHEIGHNAGTGHTHDGPNFIDNCENPAGTPQRGTIMSYCGQTWSGGNANRDLYFHSRIQQNMDAYIDSVLCVVDDCNGNGIIDVVDVNGTSQDLNENGVPDECEDCNDNQVLDDADIAAMTSADVDGNGIPDECEPDCNTNSIPDAKDIADGTSSDLYGNEIPDECEPDCDVSGTSDYSEIQADMPLDINRNTILDACEDCDGDGTIDIEALDDSHFAWVASGLDASDLRQFHASTGVLNQVSSGGAGAAIDQGHDLIVAPDGSVLVTSHGDDRVVWFDSSGGYVGDLVSAGSGGLSGPNGLVVTPDGSTLLVASNGTHSVLAYDLVSGLFVGEFVAAGAGGLTEPFGLIFGPDGNLYVTGGTNEILVYDGATGGFLNRLVIAANNGGLDQPRGVAFKQDGNLLVASFGTDEVLEFDGATGAPLGKWAQVGTATRLTQISPWGVRVGPNGNVFIARTGEDFGSGSGGAHDHDDHDHGNETGDRRRRALHLTNAQIYEFDATNGDFLRTYVGGNDHGLFFPTGFDFVPGWQLDCNVNFLPDECDIASGSSEDIGTDGIPDECQIDCDSNGVFDRLDLIPNGTQLDCNVNGVPDGCDLVGGGSADCTGNGIPDECEPDCNDNDIADSCDLDAGTSIDCNGNGIPDECDTADDLETDSGWTVGAPGDDATLGIWTRVDPNGTAAQPEDDHTPGAGNTCFVTGQGSPGEPLGDNDVDGGRTTLTSPVFELADSADAELGYWRWFSNDQGGGANEDVFQIDISNDGGTNWVSVETVGPGGIESSAGWFFHLFRVADLLPVSDEIVLRFVATDEGTGSVVEAAIDDLVVVAECCTPTMPAEIVGVSVDLVLGTTTIAWVEQGPGVVYDVVSGDLGSLLGTGTAADATCQADNLSAGSWDDARPDPTAGQAFYYLVRPQEDCGLGGYGSSSAGGKRQPAVDCGGV